MCAPFSFSFLKPCRKGDNGDFRDNGLEGIVSVSLELDSTALAALASLGSLASLASLAALTSLTKQFNSLFLQQQQKQTLIKHLDPLLFVLFLKARSQVGSCYPPRDKLIVFHLKSIS